MKVKCGLFIQWNATHHLKGILLIYATLWVNLRIMQNEKSQTKKGYILYDSIYMKFFFKSKTIMSESWSVFTRGWGVKRKT